MTSTLQSKLIIASLTIPVNPLCSPKDIIYWTAASFGQLPGQRRQPDSGPAEESRILRNHRHACSHESKARLTVLVIGGHKQNLVTGKNPLSIIPWPLHVPIQAKDEMIAKYEKKSASNGQNNPTYAAMVESVDESVGRVMDKLRELNLEENTVVIFMSDNGGLLDVTNNMPFRGSKGMIWEGGIREPMIVKWPGVVKPGSGCHELTTTTDFYPTMLEIAGLPLYPQQHCDGVCLVPLLKGSEKLHREAIFWHFPHYHPSTRPFSAIRKGDWKLIEFFEDKQLSFVVFRIKISFQQGLCPIGAISFGFDRLSENA